MNSLLWTHAGWFLAFLVAIVLPSPIVYFYYKDTHSATGTRWTNASTAVESDEGFQDNPLAEPGQSDVYDVEGSELPNVPPARAKLAKMQREAKDTRAKNQQMQTQLLQLQTELGSAKAENASLKVIATTKDESTKVQALQTQNVISQKAIAALKAQLAQVGRSPQLPALNDDLRPDNAPLQQADAKTRQVAIRELAADESLSEQTRESAKQAWDEMAAAQVRQSKILAKKSHLGRMVLPSEDMTKYLESLRLLHYADVVIRVAGMCVD